MKNLKRATLASALLFAFVAAAPAQFNRSNYEPNSVSALIDRVHDDLNRAYGAWHFSGGDRDRLNHAEKELRDFSKKWNRGKFDKGELDDAISSTQHVLDNNHLPPGERRALAEDLDQLRGMREAYNRHEIGYRR